MFRHQGKSRTAKHNLQIASVLSFVAGMVNVAGFLSVRLLTTNVTGHFAFFVDEIFQFNFNKALFFFAYVFFFFAGSFTCSYILEAAKKASTIKSYIIPVSIEIIILFSIAIFGDLIIAESPNIIICSLLFAMGLQNALVTKISNATVRTTHLTGLFTDLGIELAQLFFYNESNTRRALYTSIRLRLTIISFFFMGGFIGGLCYQKLHLNVLFIAGFTLIFGLIFDTLKLNVMRLQRKLYNEK